jgi:hypothetical protein
LKNQIEQDNLKSQSIAIKLEEININLNETKRKLIETIIEKTKNKSLIWTSYPTTDFGPTFQAVEVISDFKIRYSLYINSNNLNIYLMDTSSDVLISDILNLKTLISLVEKINIENIRRFELDQKEKELNLLVNILDKLK